MQNKFTRFLLFFLAFLLFFQLWGGKKQEKSTDDVEISIKAKITTGQEVQVRIINHRQEALSFSLPCPGNPLLVERYKNGEWLPQKAKIDPTQCSAEKERVIEPGKTTVLGYGLWNHELFGETGRYRVSLANAVEGKIKTYSREFEIKEPGIFRSAWNQFLYRPILNVLVFMISIIPGHDLGWGIIVLTLLIKILLLAPNHKALQSQKALQRLQPELDALKLKYKDDQKLLAQETMALWKKHKVNPMGSCLPMLIQMPILIALFYVVRDGLNVINPEAFYSSLKSFDVQSVNTYFLGLMDLTKKNVILLPVLVGGLQFYQMRLTLAKTNKGKEGSNPLPMMNQMMQYMMPAMIAVFTASLPAAVGFYWGTSTLFGIGQQIIVNKMKD